MSNLDKLINNALDATCEAAFLIDTAKKAADETADAAAAVEAAGKAAIITSRNIIKVINQLDDAVDTAVMAVRLISTNKQQ